MDETVSANLSQYIATRILKQPNRSIAIDEKLISSGLIDSFSLVDLSIYVEETFGVRIDDTELNARFEIVRESWNLADGQAIEYLKERFREIVHYYQRAAQNREGMLLLLY